MQSPQTRKPKLSVNILTQESESRLERLVAEVREFADEVLIGVDATSRDQTFDLSCSLADVVYRFRLPGQLSPARMLVFDYASGDWILSLDDDESIEISFDLICPTLLTNASISHVYFPRKWIVGLDPCVYAHAHPWFPNWSLRLFRNDRSIIWKPNYVHSQYYVQGTGWFEERASILHFEPVVRTGESMSRKLEMYRRTSGPSAEEYYNIPANVLRRDAVLRPSARIVRPAECFVDDKIRELDLVGFPPWKSEIISADIPDTAQTGELLLAIVTVRNTGALTWMRASHTNNNWPVLQLGNHLLDENGGMVAFDRDRAPMLRTVRPGEQGTFFCSLRAPDVAGNYFFEWDMVSENECWFSQCGGSVLRTPLRVSCMFT